MSPFGWSGLEKGFLASFLVKEKNRNNFVLEEMKRTYDSLKELLSKYKSNETPMESL